MTLAKKDLKADFQKLIERLENMILTGVFQPRERLVELNLAEDLEVSRFWVRDAFKILEAKANRIDLAMATGALGFLHVCGEFFPLGEGLAVQTRKLRNICRCRGRWRVQ